MSRFINRLEGTDEASIAALKKQNAELVEALQRIAKAPDWATIAWCKSQARLACSGGRNGFERCPTCGGEFDQGEWDAAIKCPECETPKALAKIGGDQ